MYITPRIVDPSDARVRDLPHISKKGRLLKLHDTAVMDGDGYPLIVTAGGSEIFVTHTNEVTMVDTAVVTLRRHGIPLENILVGIWLCTPALSPRFMVRARDLGVRHVWAAYPLCEFLAEEKAPFARKSLIAIRCDENTG